MTTPLEKCLITSFHKARRDWAESPTQETLAAYVKAEDDAVGDVLARGDIETPTHEYSVRWCPDSKRFRLTSVRRNRAATGWGFDWRKGVAGGVA